MYYSIGWPDQSFTKNVLYHVRFRFLIAALLYIATSSCAQGSNDDSNEATYNQSRGDGLTLEKLDKAANVGVRHYRDLRKGEECIEYYSLEDGTVYEKECVSIQQSEHFKNQTDQNDPDQRQRPNRSGSFEKQGE